MELRNWIEQAIGKQWAFPPVRIGKRGGRDYFSITWADGAEGDYFIDFIRQEIKEI